MKIDLDLELVCENCGERLEYEFSPFGNNVIVVEPCRCILEEKNENGGGE